MITEICKKEECTGCGACFNKCPRHAISMKADEHGFCHPVIDSTLCVNCRICIEICPQNKQMLFNERGTVYAALAVEDAIRDNSSSGGVFSVIARKVLNNNGVVFGAAFDGELSVHHILIEDITDLAKLRGSKYVQSEIGDSYKQAQKILDSGRQVLFSGTPCQIAGLYGFLEKSYKNLVTVDILCHGVPSPDVFKKYISSKQSQTKAVCNVLFRKKDPGWSAFSTELIYQDGTSEVDNSFYYFFVRNYILRDSCSNCHYARRERVGDITLGDFWGYKETAPEHIENDDRGISFVSINSEKGREAFESIRKQLAIAPRKMEEAVLGNPILDHPCGPHERSKEFWEDYQVLSWDELVQKYNIPREKKNDYLSLEDREYYAQPYNERHFRHKIHCLKVSVLKALKGNDK